MIFVTEQRNPCDQGLRMLAEAGKLPEIRDATLGRAKVIRCKSHCIVALVVRESVSEVIEEEAVIETIGPLLDAVTELDLKTLSICKGDVDRVP